MGEFDDGDYRRARKAFLSSLREHPSKHALFYTVACPPASLIYRLRLIKQYVTKQT
jgi:hypothetical protein